MPGAAHLGAKMEPAAGMAGVEEDRNPLGQNPGEAFGVIRMGDRGDDQHRQIGAGDRLGHVGGQQRRHLASLEDAARIDAAIGADRLQAGSAARMQPHLEPPPGQVGGRRVAAMPRPHHRYRPDFHPVILRTAATPGKRAPYRGTPVAVGGGFG